VGYLYETPNRVKLEIKTLSKKSLGYYEKFLVTPNIKYLIKDNRYTQTEYPKMIVNISEKLGTLVKENPGNELEIKFNLSNNLNIYRNIKKN